MAEEVVEKRVRAGRLGPVTPRHIMDLCVQEASGPLVVAGEKARGTLFFLHGEPVHATPLDDELALLNRLEQRKELNADARDGLSSSQPLIVQLAKKRWVRPIALLEALRDEVRDFARAIMDEAKGNWEFTYDDSFAEHTPLTAVNPFGLILEWKRRSLPPDAFLRIGEEMAMSWPAPMPGLPFVSHRLRLFTGQVDIGDIVDGTVRGIDIYKATNLDPLMGGLVLAALADAGLIELHSEPKKQKAADAASALAKKKKKGPLVVDADAKQLSQLAALPGKGGSEILGLYLELKPERDEDQILAIEHGAPRAAIERGYEARLADLDPRAIPVGKNRPYLLARVEELRSKVERAYRARVGGITQPGAAVVPYEILERIGEGGMAQVFLGRATDNPNRLVAIKRLLPRHAADADFARMFLDEARLARRIQHPNVVRVYSAGKSGDSLYIAMEFVDGCDLGELLRRERKAGRAAPIEVVCRVTADASGGLHAAHVAHDREGRLVPILHRDVSPQNIMVSVQGDVKLTDFGVAHAMEEVQSAENTLKGKLAYIAPELIDGDMPTVRSDVYAMGITLYTALARMPFNSPDPIATLRAVMKETLAPPSAYRPEVPPEIDRIVLRATARHPEERHTSAQELQLEIEEALATAVHADVGAWARSLLTSRAPKVLPQRSEETQTIVVEDVDMDL